MANEQERNDSEESHKLLVNLTSQIMATVRREYTVLPRFSYHQPLDYLINTYPARFDTPEIRKGMLPIPGPDDRMGYSPNDSDQYLETGKYDHDILLKIIDKHHGAGRTSGFRLLDFGCSSGRVLRHFDTERSKRGWKLAGIDIQARPIQWIREFFPAHFEVTTGSLMPHLPYEDNYFDTVYGISVFTHIKYLWDAWILELRRVTKPGGLIIQTFHGEDAWRFYFQNQKLDWVRQNHSPEMLKQESMNVPYFYYGDLSVGQIFWKTEVAREYWSRYLKVLEIRDPPPKFSFQNWIICKK